MDYKIIEKEAFDIIEKVEAHTVEDSENAMRIQSCRKVLERIPY